MAAQTQLLEWNGDAYHKLSDFQFDAAMELVQRLHLRGDEKLMDAGCGSGRITREVLKLLPRGEIIGVDLSGSMLETAKREVVAAPNQRVAFLQRDLQNFTELSELDGIFSNMALHFVHDHGLLFKNFARMLKPNGWLALQFGGHAPAGASTPQIFELLTEPPLGQYLQAAAFHFVASDRETTVQQLHDAGFINIEVSELPLALKGEQLEKMRKFFKETVVADCLKRLPTEDLRQRFHEQMDSAFDQALEEDAMTHLRVQAQLPTRH